VEAEVEVEVQVEVEALATVAAEEDKRTIPAMERMESGIAGGMIMITIVGHVDSISNTTV
jgi:hypothetical protein